MQRSEVHCSFVKHRTVQLIAVQLMAVQLNLVQCSVSNSVTEYLSDTVAGLSSVMTVLDSAG